VTKALKTTYSGRLATTGALLLGAFLLLALPSVMFVRAGNFTYLNRGETAWVTATNNDDNSTFRITAMNSTVVLMNDTGLMFVPTNATVITGGHFVFINGSLFGNSTEGYFNMTTFPRAVLMQNLSAAHSYGNVTIADLLTAMHSSYAMIGTGDFDHFNLTGGITSDTFSITGPGFGDQVSIFTGTGNSTYNINLGMNATVTITGTNATTIGSTTNVYNIIF
jgi:hypothetical protein